MALVVKQREIGPMENFQYFIGDGDLKRGWMVDPAWEAAAFYDDLQKEGFSVEGFLVTHAHFDHTNALETLLKRRDVPVYLQKRELEFLDKGAPRELFPDLPRSSLRPVSPGEKVSLGAATVTFVHTPGHTPGHVCVQVDGGGRQAVMSGDLMHHPVQCAEPG